MHSWRARLSPAERSSLSLDHRDWLVLTLANLERMVFSRSSQFTIRQMWLPSARAALISFQEFSARLRQRTFNDVIHLQPITWESAGSTESTYSYCPVNPALSVTANSKTDKCSYCNNHLRDWQSSLQDMVNHRRRAKHLPRSEFHCGLSKQKGS